MIEQGVTNGSSGHHTDRDGHRDAGDLDRHRDAGDLDRHRDTDDLDILADAAATDIRLYDASDLAWITIVVDFVMSCIGQPWRVLREKLEHAPLRAARVASILAAMRRMMDGRAQRTKIARKVRASVLGHPALDDDSRTERLARAGDELGIDPSEIESLLWIDLAEERPVTLPDGRPDETRLAAYANVDRIQRALRRAKHVRIHAWGNAHALIRTAARYGLLVRVSAARDHTRMMSSEVVVDNHTIIDIVGPLSLFHQTHVYGRALGSIVPLLSGLERFVVEIDADFGYGMAALRVTSPALLPPAPAERGKPSIAARIAGALERVRNVVVERDPPPLVHGTDRLFPDLAIKIIGPIRFAKNRADDALATQNAERRDAQNLEGGDLVPDLAALLAAQMANTADRITSREVVAVLPPRDRLDRSRCWYIEVVGFATNEYLTAKLARYRAAGVEQVLLVVDDTRASDLTDVRRVVPYKSQTIVAALLGIVEEVR